MRNLKLPKVYCLMCGRLLHFYQWKHPICDHCDVNPPRCLHCNKAVYYCNGKWYHGATKRAYCFSNRAEPRKVKEFEPIGSVGNFIKM